MPQKCRVKHMCMRLLVQASGNKHACRVPCLQHCSLCIRPGGSIHQAVWLLREH